MRKLVYTCTTAEYIVVECLDVRSIIVLAQGFLIHVCIYVCLSVLVYVILNLRTSACAFSKDDDKLE